MNCWICGEKGDSGEHLIKASDIRSLFGNISQQKPIYQNFEGQKKIKIGSAKSDRFKSTALICKDCNNNRTATHDMAWSKLSEYLRQYPLNKKGPLNIRLSKVFKVDRKKNVLRVHLYFVKLFGCRIVEESIPIDVESFSEAIINEKPNPHVFINFKKAIGSNLKTTALTPIYAKNSDYKTIVASWFYSVGDLNVEIMYSSSPKPVKSNFLKKSFHPDWMDRVIRFKDFEDEELDEGEVQS